MKRFSITAGDDGGMVPVFAAYDKKTGIPNKTTLSLMHCTNKKCGGDAVINKLLHPGCPMCASEMKPATDQDLPLNRADFSNMKKVADCPHCGSTITVPEEMQASLDDGKLYCIICSHVISAEGEEGEENTISTEEEDEDENEEDELNETVTEPEDEALFDNPAMADNNSTENSGESADGGENSTATPPATPESTPPAANTAPTTTTETTNTETPPAAENTAPAGDTNTETNTENAGGDSLNASLLPLFANKEAAVEVMPNEDHTKWYLFADKTPVAVAEISRAGENVQQLFKSDKFRDAFKAATSEGVTEDVLNNFGFEPTTVDVPVDEAVRQTVEAQVNERIKEFDKKTNELVDRFNACVGIAAVGINKGIYGTNPLKAALIASIENAGVRNAEVIVDQVFEKHGEDAQREIVEKALELMDKTPEAITEVSELVASTPYIRKGAENRTKKVVFSSFASTDLEEDQNNVVAPLNTIEASDDGDEDYSVLFRHSSGRRH